VVRVCTSAPRSLAMTSARSVWFGSACRPAAMRSSVGGEGGSGVAERRAAIFSGSSIDPCSANYGHLQGRLTAVDVDAYLAEDEPAAPLARKLNPNQLCVFAQGNSFVHDLPTPKQTCSAKTAAGRELRQVCKWPPAIRARRGESLLTSLCP
jgi:hypothetical protein